MKHLAVLTSGGDAPGMNAAIRAVVRTAIHEHVQVSGVYNGYQGLLDDDIRDMGARSVANIIHRGGTILRTARCRPFLEPEGRRLAAENLRRRGIEGLVVIGGNGSLRGAAKLFEEQGVAVIGIPGTIDNDIFGTDVSVGFNTAINIALDAIRQAARHRCQPQPAVPGRSDGEPVRQHRPLRRRGRRGRSDPATRNRRRSRYGGRYPHRGPGTRQSVERRGGRRRGLRGRSHGPSEAHRRPA